MKRVFVCMIGGASFNIEEEAQVRLKNYLKRYELSIKNAEEAKEVMEDVELRIAEIFRETLKEENQVVDDRLVDKVIQQIGKPEKEEIPEEEPILKARKKLYRNPDNIVIGGVCGGIAAYLDVDPTLVRLVVIIGAFGFGIGFLAYLIAWLIVPKANTIVQKLEMRGEPVTEENIRNYSLKHSR